MHAEKIAAALLIAPGEAGSANLITVLPAADLTGLTVLRSRKCRDRCSLSSRRMGIGRNIYL